MISSSVAPYANANGSYGGESYVVFGSAAGFPASLDLAALDGTTGFRIVGTKFLGHSGASVASAGDVNGYGIDDLIVGAPHSSFGAYQDDRAGESYVVFGSAAGFSASVDLSALDGTNGFRLIGMPGEYSGVSVAGAGDVNGDGIEDLIVGLKAAIPAGEPW